MSNDELARARIIVPGSIIVGLGIWPFLRLVDINVFINNVVALGIGTIVFFALVFFFGGVYRVLRMRPLVLRRALEQIGTNIKSQLVKPFSNDPEMTPVIAFLQKDNSLLHVFYSFVDHDEALKAQARRVYLNGLYLSTCADITILGTFFAFFYLIAAVLLQTSAYALIPIFLVALVFITRYLILPGVIKDHMELGTRQVSYIVRRKKNELREDLIEAAKTGS